MLEALIPSRTRVRLLTLFLSNPGKEYYIREIVRITGENMNAVRRELANLERFGLITGEKKGNLHFYTADTRHFLYHDLQKIVLKTEGAAAMIREALSGEPGIACIFIYGSFARGAAGAKSDIDLFIVGDLDENRLIPLVSEIEHVTGREINYTLMTAGELALRKERADPFVKNVMSEEKIMVIGACDD